jgi:protein-tyrosine-phosphatase
MPSILIVCTANICRSPMAEAILKRLVSKRPDADQWHIESAGTWALKGCSAAENSQSVMQSMGLDIHSHRSQAVSLDMIHRFDLILTMENNHKEGLIAGFNLDNNRIYLLSEMVGLSMDIPDPIRGQIVNYEETARLLERILSEGIERIYQIATENQKSSQSYQESK